MNNTFAYDVVTLTQTDRLVALLYENLLDVFKLVTQLLLFNFLSLNLGDQCFVFGILFDDLLTATCYALLGLTNQLHHSLDFRYQDVFLLLLCLSVLVFTFNFCVFELTDFGLQSLVSIIDFGGLFLSLFKFLFESFQLVFVFFLLLLGLFKLESFRIEIELDLLGLLLNLGLLCLV